MDDNPFQTVRNVMVKDEPIKADPAEVFVTEPIPKASVIKRDLSHSYPASHSDRLETAPHADQCVYEIHNAPVTETVHLDDNKDQLSLITHINVSHNHVSETTDTVENRCQSSQSEESYEEARYMYYSGLTSLECDGSIFIANCYSIKQEPQTVPSLPPPCKEKDPFQPDPNHCDVTSTSYSRCSNMVDGHGAQPVQPIVIAPIADYDEDTKFIPNQCASGQKDTDSPADSISCLQSNTDQTTVNCAMDYFHQTERNDSENFNVIIEPLVEHALCSSVTGVVPTLPTSDGSLPNIIQCSSQALENVPPLPISAKDTADGHAAMASTSKFKSLDMNSVSSGKENRTKVLSLSGMVEAKSEETFSSSVGDNQTTSDHVTCITQSVAETCERQPNLFHDMGNPHKNTEMLEEQIASIPSPDHCKIVVTTEQSSPLSVLNSEIGSGSERIPLKQ